MLKSKKIVTELVVLAVLTALIVVLQLFAQFFKIGTFQITLVLIPIAVGAILYGPLAGFYLGFIFGLVVLLSGDAALFIGISPVATVVGVLLKGALAGLVTGFVYKALKNVNQIAAIIVAACLTPVVNTGVFSILFLTSFSWTPEMKGIMEGAGMTNPFVFLFIGMIGVNFFIEFGITTVLSPAIARICQIGMKVLNLGDEAKAVEAVVAEDAVEAFDVK